MVILGGCLGCLARKRPSSTSSLRERSRRPFYNLPVISCPLRSYEHGVNTFDVANSYSNGVSEVYLGRAIKALNLPREEMVVMTKVMWSASVFMVPGLKHCAVVRSCR